MSVRFDGYVTVDARTMAVARYAAALGLEARFTDDPRRRAELSKQLAGMGVRGVDVDDATANASVTGTWRVADGHAPRLVAEYVVDGARQGVVAELPPAPDLRKKYLAVTAGAATLMFEIEYRSTVDIDGFVQEFTQGLGAAIDAEILPFFLHRFQSDDIRINVVTDIEYKTLK